MKKMLLVGLMSLMCLLGHRAQAQYVACTDTVTTFPYVPSFGINLGCWTPSDSSSWMDWTYGEVPVVRVRTSTTTDQWLVSPPLQLPYDTVGLKMNWDNCKSGGSQIDYLVLVSSDDGTTWDTIDTWQYYANQTHLQNEWPVDMTPYAGQTVRVAFCVPAQSGGQRWLTIANLNIRGDRMPWGDWWSYVVSEKVGDTVQYEFYLSSGVDMDSSVVFTWHSTMADAGLATAVDTNMYMMYQMTQTGMISLPGSVLRMVYLAEGIDTVTITASNAYGTVSQQTTPHFHDCRPISTFPWTQTYEPTSSMYVCWQIENFVPYTGNTTHGLMDEDDENHSVGTYGFMESHYTNRGYLVTPPIAIPGEGSMSNHLALTLIYGSGDMEVRVGAADATDTALFADTLFREAQTNNNRLKTRKINLGAYAGDTIRLAIIHKGGNNMDLLPVSIDYDLLPKLRSLSLQAKTVTDSATLCTAALRFGSTDGLHYTWHSAIGGTFASNALGDSAWVTYGSLTPSPTPNGEGSVVDTITVVATNLFGSDTQSATMKVVDCTPATTLPWVETFFDGAVCWYIPEGSNWHDAKPYSYYAYYYDDTYRALVSPYTEDTVDQWVVSKAIHIPADTNAMVLLEWDVAAEMGSIEHQPNYDVLVSTAEDRTDLTAYQLLLSDTSGVVSAGGSWQNMGHRSASLSAYAGQTIHVAFCKHPAYYNITSEQLVIDNVTVRSAAVPVIALSAPQNVTSNEEVTYTVTLVEGSTNGLTYSWHSTLLDTSFYGVNGLNGSNVLTLLYPFGGEDTITVIASNAYGSDTASVVVSVIGCPYLSTPWSENFDSVTSTAYNVAGEMPDCWRVYWNGSNPAYAPHVCNSYHFGSINNYANQPLLLLAGNGFASGWDTVAIVESPYFAETLAGKRLSLYYLYETPNRGTLSVGYIEDNTFVNLADMEPLTEGRTDTVSFIGVPATVHRFAIQWKHTGGWFAAMVDNLQVMAADTLPEVHITVPEQLFVGDTAVFTAHLDNGLTDGLTFSWHSTLLDEWSMASSQWPVVYPQTGTDTVTVIATTAYGADTATVIVTVNAHPLPQATLSGSSVVYIPDVATFAVSINECSQQGLVVSLRSTLMDMIIYGDNGLNGVYEFNVNYTSEGIDTVTVIVSNNYGADTATAVVTVIYCGTQTLPWFEDFEGVAGTNSSTEGQLPTCWTYNWNGSLVSRAPHVISSNGYRFISNLPDNALLMLAGSATGHGTLAEVALPLFADSLHTLAMAFDYRFENTTVGTLTVGFYDVDNVFTTVKTILGHSGSYLRDTVSFANASLSSLNEYTHIVLRWQHNSSYFGVAVDNIEVFPDNPIHAPANLTVDSIGHNSAVVSWQTVPGATAYHLVATGFNTAEYTVQDTVFFLTGLAPTTQYTVRVAAVVEGDTGSYAQAQFYTLCGTIWLPYFNDFSQADASITCWTPYRINSYVTSEQLLVQRNAYSVCHMATPIIEAPGNTLFVSFRLRRSDQYASDPTVLIAGVMTDPNDYSTFMPIDTFTAVNNWTEFQFNTRGLDTTPVALAFRPGGGIYNYNGSLIDNLLIEAATPCAALFSAEANVLGSRSVELSWVYDTYSELPIEGVLIDLHDLTSGETTTFVAHGTDTIFDGLPMLHSYSADIRTLCSSDTADAITLNFTLEPMPCVEVHGNDNYTQATPFVTNTQQNYGYSQILYPADFAASVDTLYGIAFYYTGYPEQTRVIDVYIGQTSANSLTTPISANNLTLAVQNFAFSSESQFRWVKIPFTNPVPLDGVNNLVVTIDDNTGSGYNNSVSCQAHHATIGSFLIYNVNYGSGTNVNPYTLGFNVTSSSNIPDIQLLGHCAGDRCLQPFISVQPDTNSLTVAWSQRGSESLWRVEYRHEGDNTWMLADSTADTTYTIVGLNASSRYDVRVGSMCSGSVVYSDAVTTATLCGAVDVPFYQNFMMNSIPCWNLRNGYPSTSWGMDLDCSLPIVSPAINGDLSQMRVRFTISGNPNFNPVVKVGIGNASGTNATWFDSIMLSHSGVEEYTVYFGGYTGGENHLLFIADDPYARIRELNIEYFSCQAVHHVDMSQLTNSGAVMQWPPVDEEGGEWAVYLDDSLLAVVSTPTYTLSGLTSATDYTFSVREVCGFGDTSEATTLQFTTLCEPNTLPWTENFESLPYSFRVVPQCWSTIFPPFNVSGTYSLAFLSYLGNSRTLCIEDNTYSSQHDPTIGCFIISPLFDAAGQAITVEFDASMSQGEVTVGLMTDVTDSNTFVALGSLNTSATHYQFSSPSSPLSTVALAFRFRGTTYCDIDNISVTATPLPTFDVTLAVNDTTMGSVSGEGTYQDGSTITIAAVANDGYHFVEWSDSVTEAVREITVRGNITLTAYFAADTTPVTPPDTTWHDVTVTTNVAGVAQTFGSGRYIHGDTVEVGFYVIDTMAEGGHWHFSGWDNGLSDNPCQIIITSDSVVTALFQWVADSVGIGDNPPLPDASFLVYPNPASTVVYVDINESCTLSIMTETGREVMRVDCSAGSTTVDISTLAAGVYFFRPLGTALPTHKLIVR